MNTRCIPTYFLKINCLLEFLNLFKFKNECVNYTFEHLFQTILNHIDVIIIYNLIIQNPFKYRKQTYSYRYYLLFVWGFQNVPPKGCGVGSLPVYRMSQFIPTVTKFLKLLKILLKCSSFLNLYPRYRVFVYNVSCN